MTRIQQQQFLPFSTEQMFCLVNDIEQYPQFLPFCAQAKILRADDKQVQATLFIQKGPLSLQFSTVNYLTAFSQIQMKLLDGPFKSLDGVWQFTEMGTGSKISLILDFELKAKLLKLTLGPLFSSLAQNMVDIFCKRAKQIYG